MKHLTDAQLLQTYYSAGLTLAEIADSLDWSSGQRPPATREERNAEQSQCDSQAEIERRFGAGAIDRLATYFTATRATPEEMFRDACHDPALLVTEATRTPAEIDAIEAGDAAAEMAWRDSKFYGHA